jgi:hypothetical protein
MARAALSATGADRWSVEQWEERAGRVGLKISERLKREPKAAPVKPAADQPAAVEQKAERKRRGGWLGDTGGRGRRGGWL